MKKVLFILVNLLIIPSYAQYVNLGFSYEFQTSSTVFSELYSLELPSDTTSFNQMRLQSLTFCGLYGQYVFKQKNAIRISYAMSKYSPILSQNDSRKYIGFNHDEDFFGSWEWWYTQNHLKLGYTQPVFKFRRGTLNILSQLRFTWLNKKRIVDFQQRQSDYFNNLIVESGWDYYFADLNQYEWFLEHDFITKHGLYYTNIVDGFLGLSLSYRNLFIQASTGYTLIRSSDKLFERALCFEISTGMNLVTIHQRFLNKEVIKKSHLITAGNSSLFLLRFGVKQDIFNLTYVKPGVFIYESLAGGERPGYYYMYNEDANSMKYMGYFVVSDIEVADYPQLTISIEKNNHKRIFGSLGTGIGYRRYKLTSFVYDYPFSFFGYNADSLITEHTASGKDYIADVFMFSAYAGIQINMVSLNQISLYSKFSGGAIINITTQSKDPYNYSLTRLLNGYGSAAMGISMNNHTFELGYQTCFLPYLKYVQSSPDHYIYLAYSIPLIKLSAKK